MSAEIDRDWKTQFGLVVAELDAERQRADYAWRNTKTLEAARQEEMRKRDVAEAENVRLRTALQYYVDGLYGGPAREALATRNAKVTGDAASSRRPCGLPGSAAGDSEKRK